MFCSFYLKKQLFLNFSCFFLHPSILICPLSSPAKALCKLCSQTCYYRNKMYKKMAFLNCCFSSKCGSTNICESLWINVFCGPTRRPLTTTLAWPLILKKWSNLVTCHLKLRESRREAQKLACFSTLPVCMWGSAEAYS